MMTAGTAGTARRPRALVALAAVAMLGSACVSPDDPGVTVESRKANLVFGVEEPAEPVAPSSIGAARQAGGFDELGAFEFKSVKPDLGSIFEFLTIEPTEQPVQECPKAPGNAVPKAASEVNVTALPNAGVYKWKGITREINALQQVVREDTTYERRAIRRVKRLSATKFSYEVVQPLDKNFLVSVFQVETAGVQHRPPHVAQGVVEPPPTPRDPEAGVVLKSTEVVDAKGSPVPGIRPWKPQTGLLLMPLPVNSGERFVSTASDPASGKTIYNDGRVLKRERVDACGEIVDSWYVKTAYTVAQNGSSKNYRYQYYVANQLGGLVIREQLANQGTAAVPDFSDWTIGQVNPDALPPTAS